MSRASAQARRTGLEHIALGDHAAAVAHLDPLPGGQPQHVDGVPALGAADQQVDGVGQLVEEEQRRPVELGHPVVGGDGAHSVSSPALVGLAPGVLCPLVSSLT